MVKCGFDNETIPTPNSLSNVISGNDTLIIQYYICLDRNDCDLYYLWGKKYAPKNYKLNLY